MGLHTAVTLCAWAVLLSAAKAAVTPQCTSPSGLTPLSVQDSPTTHMLLVSFGGEECGAAVQSHFTSTIAPYVTSNGGTAQFHQLSATTPLPSLLPFNQVWVVDLSADAADATHTAAFASLAAWWQTGAETHVVADGRFAASTMRTAGSCYPSLTGANNDALIRNYVDNLAANGGGLLLAADFFTNGMDELCDALGLNRFGRDYAAAESWSSDAEFATGTLASTTTELAGGGKLTLSATISTPFPFIWIPLSGRGTVAKIDTVTGVILGEYRSAPSGRGTNPSRTTVDREGRVWAGNRGEADGGRGSVVCVGLKESGQCVDRNGNGVIDTSSGLGDVRSWGGNSDGGVTGAADECILYYVRTSGTGVRAVALDAANNVWVGGWSNKRHDLINGETGAIMRTWAAPHGAYGALVDSLGRVWSAGWCDSFCQGIVVYNPTTDFTQVLTLGGSTLYRVYGMGIDSLGYVWATNYHPTGSATIMRVHPNSLSVVGRFHHGNYPTGVAVESNDHVWYASRVSSGYITHIDNQHDLTTDRYAGSYPHIADIVFGNAPSGVSIDAAGKIWCSCVHSWDAYRFHPRTHVQELRVYTGDNSAPYNYGDMTGTVVIANTADPEGSWTRRQDAGGPATWHRVSWSVNVPVYGEILAEARAGDTVSLLEAAVFREVNIGKLDGFNGRYIEIRVTITLFDREVTNEERAALYVDSISAEYTRTDFDRAVVPASSGLLLSPASAAVSSTPATVDGVSSTFRLEADGARMVAPWGRQPSGVQLYAHAWMGDDRTHPAITSTIPGPRDFRLSVSSPACAARVSPGNAVTLTAAVPVAGQAPYAFSWQLPDGTVLATGQSAAWSVPAGWTPGSYTIVSVATDARGDVATAQVELLVRNPAGAACVSNDECVERFCVNAECCAPGACDVSTSAGEAFLRAAFIELGVHASGSFGTDADPPAGFNGATGAAIPWGTGLGFIADYGKDGFGVGSPPFSGDCFVPGDVLEGWALSFRPSLGADVVTAVNKGRAGSVDIPPTHTSAKSTAEATTAVWVGVSGPLTIRKVTTLTDALHFTTSVTLSNTGTDTLYDVAYLRSVDPDQEQPWTGNFATRNYVKYQPPRAGDPAGRSRAGATDTALVASEGVTHAGLYLGLGAVHANARVTHGSRDVRDPLATHNDMAWAAYGDSNKREADEAISLVAKWDSLDAGASVDFQWAYVLSEAAFDEAMDALSAVTVLTPSGVASGSSTTFSVSTQATMESVQFYVIDADGTQHDVGSTTEESFLFVEGGGMYQVDMDTTAIVPEFGVVTLKAVATAPDGTTFITHRVIDVDNRGPVLGFTATPTDGTFAFKNFEPTALTLALQSGDTPDTVTFYRETRTTSVVIGVDTAPPFNVAVTASDLAVNTPVTIRAVSRVGTVESVTTFTGRVRELNQAPRDIQLSKATVPEHAAADTLVGVLTATDANQGDVHVFTVEAEFGAAGYNPLEVQGDLLIVAAAHDGSIDFEATPTLSLLVTATDENGASLTERFEVAVLNLAEDPTDVLLSHAAVDENVLLGTTVGSFTAVDDDAGDTHSWSVSEAQDKFRVEGNVLKVNGALDHETQATRTVTATATDATGRAVTKTFAIAVNDVNEEPLNVRVNAVAGNNVQFTEEGIEYLHYENLPENSVVGIMAATDDDDADGILQSHTFTIDSNPNGAFTLVVVDGVTQLVATQTFDYEVRNSYELTMTVTDDGSPPLSRTQQIIIAVRDEAEPPSTFNEVFFVDENVPENTFVGIVRATAQNQDLALEFAITGGNEEGVFRIDSCSGVVFVDDSPLGVDYERTPSYELTVTVFGEIDVNSTVAVHVNPINERPSLVADSATVDENLAAGVTVFGPITWSDPDAGDSVSFTIRSGDPLGAFAMDPATGALTVADATVLDFESSSRFILRVAATDKGTPALTTEADFVVELADVNEAPVLGDGARVLPENVNVDTRLGAALAPFDQDAGQSLRLSFTDPTSLLVDGPATAGAGPVLTAAGGSTTVTVTQEADYQAIILQSQLTAGGQSRFVVAKNGGSPRTVTVDAAVDWHDGGAGVVFTMRHPVFRIDQDTRHVLVASPVVDFEAVSEYVLGVAATDDGVGELSATATLTITITNVNEAPAMENQVLSITEAAPVGTAVSPALVATDVDAGAVLLFTVTYASTGAASAFSLDARTGVFSVVGGLDFEVTPSYAFGVDVTDEFGLSVPAEVAINLIDDDEPPRFSSSALSVSVFELPQAVVGDVGGVFNQGGDLVDSHINAFDPEGTPLAFAIVGGAPAGCTSAFAIERVATGPNPDFAQVVVADVSGPAGAVLDREALGGAPFCTLDVTVTDGDGQVGTATITVHVEDVNERPVIEDQAATMRELTAGAVTVDATDPDAPSVPSFSVLTYAIIGGNTGGRYAINPVSGVITPVDAAAQTFDPSNPAANVADLVVEVSDPQTLSATATVTISIVNDNFPPMITAQNFTIVENSPAGTVLGAFTVSDEDLGDEFEMSLSSGGPAGDAGAPVFVFEPTANKFVFEFKVGSGAVVGAGRPADGALNFEALPYYRLSAQVKDLHPASPGLPSITTSVPVWVWVTNANESPYVPDAVLEEAFAVVEGTPNQVPIRGTFAAADVDAGDVLTYEATNTAGGRFAVNATSGLITVADTAGIDFEVAAAHDVTIVVRDAAGASVTTTITIAVVNANEAPAVDTGLEFQVWEDAAADTAVVTLGDTGLAGAVTSSDPDRVEGACACGGGAACEGCYVLYSMAAHPVFTIDSDTGVIRLRPDVVAGNSGLDYEGQDRYELTVTATDAGVAGDTTSLSGSATVVVHVRNVNDVAITGFNGPTSLPTAGGATLLVLGRDFTRSMDPADGSPWPATTVSFGGVNGTDVQLLPPTGNGHCEVTSSTILACTTPEGYGVGHAWRVAVGDDVYVGRSLSFAPPAICDIVGAGAMATSGSALTIRGSNFGAVGTPVKVVYGPVEAVDRYTADCAVSTPHTELACTSAPGVGQGLRWRVDVGGRNPGGVFGTPEAFPVAVASNATSGDSPNITIAELPLFRVLQTTDNCVAWDPEYSVFTAYAPPQVAAVSLQAPVASALSSAGGDVVTLSGTNFGPLSATSPVGVYVTFRRGAADDDIVFEGVDCEVTVAHTGVRCTTPPGVGGGHVWAVHVGRQASWYPGLPDVSGTGAVVMGDPAQQPNRPPAPGDASNITTAYRAPAIDAVRSATDRFDTKGGAVVTLLGSDFGEAVVTNSQKRLTVTYGPPGDTARFVAQSCLVTVNHVEVQCLTAPGVGTNLTWVAWVDGQVSNEACCSAYAWPTIASYDGPGSANAVTQGGEVVRILGRQFGPAGASTLDSVTYGPLTGREFTAGNCSVVVAHEEVACLSAPGAGKDHQWIVVVEGQESRAPLTSYGPPEVVAFDGAGAAAASTDGNQTVIVAGLNFAPPAGPGVPTYLQRVTYGPATGEEYDATHRCAVLNHTAINCTTVPGMGAALTWIVTVAGQQSEKSTAVTSYAPPAVVSMTVDGEDFVTGPTNGLQQGYRGRAAVVVDVVATGLAVHDPLSSVFVEFGHAEYTTVVTPVGGVAKAAPGAAEDVFQFELPPGRGRDVVVRVGVRLGGTVVYSAPRPFAYADPIVDIPLTQESRDPSFVLAMALEGRNFGDLGSAVAVFLIHDAGEQFVNGGPHPDTVPYPEDTSRLMTPCDNVARLDHNSVTCSTNVLEGSILVLVSTAPDVVQASNTMFFKLFSPSLLGVDCSSGCDAEDDGSVTFSSTGGTRLEIAGRHMLGAELSITIAGKECADVEIDATDLDNQIVSCTVPPGIGRRITPVITRGGQPSVGGPVINYAPPRPTSIEVWQWQTPDGMPASPAARRLQAASLVLLSLHNAPFDVSEDTYVRLPSSGEAVLRVRGSDLGGDEPKVYVGFRGQSLAYQELAYTAATNTSSHAYSELEAPPGCGDGIALEALGGVVGCASDPAGTPATGYVLLITTPDTSPPDSCDDDTWVNPDVIPIRFDPPRVLSATPGGPTSGASMVLTGQGLGCPNAFLGPDVRVGAPGVDASLVNCGSGCGGLDPTRCSAGPNTFMCTQHSDCVATAEDCLVPCTVSHFNGTTVVCDVAEGQGVGHPVSVTVGGQTATRSFTTFANTPEADGDAGTLLTWSYDAPVVDDITPPGAPTTGGDTVTLTGSNFGPAPCVQAWLSGVPAGDTLCGADLTAASHTAVSFAAPEGVGAIRFSVQTHASSGVSHPDDAAAFADFTYDAPVLSGMVPTAGPTAGERDVTVSGLNFGRRELVGGFEVRFGAKRCRLFEDEVDLTTPPSDRECVLKARTHTSLTFTNPSGIGVDLPVTVAVADQVPVTPLTFTYDPPVVVALTRRPVDANGGSITVIGNDFGTAEDNIDAGVVPQVTVSGLPCGGGVGNDSTVEWTRRDELQCDMARVPVGPHNITVYVGFQQSAVAPASAGIVEATCAAGWYGAPTEFCRACPQGGYCPGGEPNPIAEAGWWGIVDVDTVAADGTQSGKCTEEGLAVPQRLNCTRIVRCEPPEACLFDNTCATGYASEPPLYRCSSCADGYYKRANRCQECPKNPWILIVFFVVAALALCVMGFVLNKKRMQLSFLSIGVDYFQVLALFANTNVEWPAAIKDVWHYLSAFNLNLEITAPECSIPNVNFKTKWAVSQLLPIAATAIYATMFIGLYIYKRLIKGRTGPKLWSHAPALVASLNMAGYFLYLFVVRSILDVFNCAPTTPPDPDGSTYMRAVFVKCWESGGLHLELFPWAVIAFGVYAVGFPVYVGYTLIRHRFLVATDQVLRAYGQGHNRATNVHAYTFRKMHSKLYYHFKPDYAYFWVLVILGRKLLIAVVSLLFSNNVTFQMATLLLVMFIAYALQVRHSPFMSPAQYYDIILDHQRQAEKYPSGMHASIHATVVEAKKRSTKTSRKPVNLGGGLRTVLSKSGTYMFNYNTVESTLLFSTVLITLAAVMFSSGQLDEEFYSVHRDFLTWCLVLVLVVSIGYYLTVLCLEIYVTLCGATKVEVKANGKSSKPKPTNPSAPSSSAGGVPRRRSRRASALWRDLDAADANGDLEARLNPLFNATGIKMSNSDLGVFLSNGEPPSSEVWDSVRVRLADVVKDHDRLMKDVAALKRQQQSEVANLTRSTAAAAGFVRATGAPTKKKFAPMSGPAGGRSGSGRLLLVRKSSRRAGKSPQPQAAAAPPPTTNTDELPFTP